MTYARHTPSEQLQASSLKPVSSVDGFDRLILFRDYPPTLSMSVFGRYSTTGWSQAVLLPRVYVQEPEDGIQEFDLVAAAPSGLVLQIEVPMTAEITMKMPKWARGVRVYSAKNQIEQLFPAQLEPMSDAVDIGAGDDTETMLLDGKAVGYDSALMEVEESSFTFLRSAQTCSEFQLASLNIPETKTEWEVRCILKDPFSGKCLTKTKVPIIYRRTSKLRLVARVCYPSGQAVEADVKDCAQQAIIAGVAVGVLTSGNLAAAAAALKSYLVACLETKLGKVLDDIAVDLRREKTAGEWKKL